MSGVIYYKTKYGATEQYAKWLSQDLGFELKNIKKGPKPGSENIVVIGSNIIMGKLKARGWILKHWSNIQNKEVIILAVGGAKIGSKDRDEAMTNSLPSDILDNVKVFHLRGRFDHSKVNFLLSKMIKKGMENEKDPVVKKEWTQGFDDVKREYLEPIISYIKRR
jgi:menaquinone-dependent protoporphyrinogen IX oxidase